MAPEGGRWVSWMPPHPAPDLKGEASRVGQARGGPQAISDPLHIENSLIQTQMPLEGQGG